MTIPPHSAPRAPRPPRAVAREASPPGHTLATLLTSTEQQRVEVACQGAFHPRHVHDADQLVDALRAEPVAAVLVSVTRYQPRVGASLARVVREFPRVPMVALVTEPHPHMGQALLAMGQLGVRGLVDVRTPNGWRDLRRAIHLTETQAIEHQAMQRLGQALPANTPDGMRTFLTTLFRLPHAVTTVQHVADRLGVCSTTFMSRFYRAKLPPAKHYLAYARVVRAAHLLENPGHSLTQVALLLEYSSPQSFSRHLQHLLQVTATEFRATMTASLMLDRFIADLITPYRHQLATFDPLLVTPPWLARSERLKRPA